MSSKRMTANPIKAPRYRPGKPIADTDSSSYSEDSEEEAPAESTQPISAPPKITSFIGNLSKVDLNERRQLGVAKEAARAEELKALRAKEEEGFVTESEEEEEEIVNGVSSDDEGYDDESREEDEDSSEEEQPRRVLMRPKFIKKDKRNDSALEAGPSKTENDQIAAEEARKIAAANEIVEEQIKKDIAARAAGKKNWDDDEEEDEIDDTDDIDPEAEYAAWKLRELQRIRRERLEIEEREKEREETERRKNLTAEERKREDDEHISKQREEKESKGKMSYMQKYYHKGAFYQDEAKSFGLDQRDIMGSKIQDDHDRSLLPKYFQQRDMTKIGKKGATKYRDLKTEDTGHWGQDLDRPRRDNMGWSHSDERFKPDRDRASLGASGANGVPVGERKRPLNAPDGPRAMNEKYQSRNNRSRSRSRSPGRSSKEDHQYRRRRSASTETDRYDRDKRQRLDKR